MFQVFGSCISVLVLVCLVFFRTHIDILFFCLSEEGKNDREICGSHPVDFFLFFVGIGEYKYASKPKTKFEIVYVLVFCFIEMKSGASPARKKDNDPPSIFVFVL